MKTQVIPFPRVCAGNSSGNVLVQIQNPDTGAMYELEMSPEVARALAGDLVGHAAVAERNQARGR